MGVDPTVSQREIGSATNRYCHLLGGDTPPCRHPLRPTAEDNSNNNNSLDNNNNHSTAQQLDSVAITPGAGGHTRGVLRRPPEADHRHRAGRPHDLYRQQGTSVDIQNILG